MPISKLHLLVVASWTAVSIFLILIVSFGFYGFLVGSALWLLLLMLLCGGVSDFWHSCQVLIPPIIEYFYCFVVPGSQYSRTIRPIRFRRSLPCTLHSAATNDLQLDQILQAWKLFATNWPHALFENVESDLEQLVALIPTGQCRCYYSIENYMQSLMINQKLFKRLNMINHCCGNNAQSAADLISDAQLRNLKRICTDLVLAAAFIPARLDQIANQKRPSFPIEYDAMRYCVAMMPLECSLKLLKLLATGRAEPSLWTLVACAYAEDAIPRTFPARVLLLSLCQYSFALRRRIQSDPLWTHMLSLPPAQLGPWLFACSSHMEQYFLNTCKTAAYNQSLVAHAPSIVVLLNLTEMVCEQLREERGGPEYLYFGWRCALPQEVRVQVTQFERMLTELRASVSAQLRHTDTTTPLLLSNAFSLTQDWNYALQRMSQFFLQQRPIYLTAKPIPDDWETSAKLMSLLSALALPIPGMPPLTTRTRGAPRTLPRMRQQFLSYSPQIEVSMRHYWETNQSLLRKMLDLTERVRAAVCAHLDDTADQCIAELWQVAWAMGGVIIAYSDRIMGIEVAHLGYLTPFLDRPIASSSSGVDERRCFLLSDPEYSTFKMMRFSHMRHFISQSTYSFDLFDVE